LCGKSEAFAVKVCFQHKHHKTNSC